jgi:hypothetical protein
MVDDNGRARHLILVAAISGDRECAVHTTDNLAEAARGELAKRWLQ